MDLKSGINQKLYIYTYIDYIESMQQKKKNKKNKNKNRNKNKTK